MSEADARRWVNYYHLKNERWHRLEWMIGQLTATLFNVMKGAETDPADWIPGEPEESEPVHLTDRELALELARSLGAKVIYKEKT